MLQSSPTKRLNIADIIGHPWMKGKMPSKEEVIQEMLERKKKDKKVKEASFLVKGHSLDYMSYNLLDYVKNSLS